MTRSATASMKSRSWLTKRTAPAYEASVSSSHVTLSVSRWLVGSSRMSTSGWASRRRPRAARIRHPPDMSVSGRVGVAGREAQPGQHPVGVGLDARSRRAPRSGSAPRRTRPAPGRARRRRGGQVSSCSRASRCSSSLDLRPPGQHLVEHRAVPPLGDLLGQVADGQVLGPVHLAAVGLGRAEDDLEQRGLAGAVPAHERDPPPGRSLERDVPEQHPRAVGLRQPRDGDHRRLSPVRRASPPRDRSGRSGGRRRWPPC